MKVYISIAITLGLFGPLLPVQALNLRGDPTNTADHRLLSWTDHVSEETGRAASCKTRLVEGLRCKGRYCDEISLLCSDSLKGLSRNTAYTTPYISDDHQHEEMKCDTNYYLTAVKCDGRFCDNLELTCTKFDDLMDISQGDCMWDNHWVSEENNSESTNPLRLRNGYYAAGMKCRDKFCDEKQIWICPAAEKEPPAMVSATTQIATGYWEKVAGFNGEITYTAEWYWETSESVSEAEQREISKEIELSISSEFSFDAPATGGPSSAFGVSVTSSFAETTARSLERTLSMTSGIKEAFQIPCNGDIYRWVLAADSDSTGTGYKVVPNDYLCLPWGSDPPKCIPDECSDRHCQTCSPDFERLLIDSGVSTGPSGSSEGYCSWHTCNGPDGNSPWCNESEANCEGACEGTWCDGGSNPPPPPPSPSPPSTAGYCAWHSCNGADDSSPWCNESQGNCEGACEGTWCDGGSNNATPPPPPPSTEGTCGGGSRGDGICADGSCCSEFGWCGTSSDHCGGFSGGYCAWHACNGADESSTWCNESRGNCEGACEGTWCAGRG